MAQRIWPDESSFLRLSETLEQWQTLLDQTRGFELSAAQLLLALSTAAGRKLDCTRTQLSSITGLSSTSAGRIAAHLVSLGWLSSVDTGQSIVTFELTDAGHDLACKLVSSIDIKCIDGT